MRRSPPIRVFYILTILTLTIVTRSIDIPIATTEMSPGWHVLDTITPTIGRVEWVEEANYSMPPSCARDRIS